MKHQLVTIVTTEESKVSLELGLFENGVLKDSAYEEVICDPNDPAFLLEKLAQHMRNAERKEGTK